MRTRGLDFGIESISYWRVGDEFHLPAQGKAAQAFQLRHSELDDILRRPSLDERLTDVLLPENLDHDILEPTVLSATRQETRQLVERAEPLSAAHREALDVLVEILGEDAQFEQLVRSAIASLLKG
jgi:hypothetical protein